MFSNLTLGTLGTIHQIYPKSVKTLALPLFSSLKDITNALNPRVYPRYCHYFTQHLLVSRYRLGSGFVLLLETKRAATSESGD